MGSYPFAGKRLLAAKITVSDDALLSNALSKIRNIILLHPEDSQLGRAMLGKAGEIVGEDVLQKPLRDSVAGKAVGTVAKRAADFNTWAVWRCHRRPLSPTGNDAAIL